MKFQVSILFAAVSLIPAPTLATPDGEFLTGKFTCAALDAALAAHDDKFFDGWTDADFDGVKTTADPNITTVCRKPGPVFLQMPASVRRVKALDAQRVRTRERNAAAREAKAQQAAEAEANASAFAAKVRLCRESPASRIYIAQRNLLVQIGRKSAAESDLARQKRIGAISGAVDMTAMHRDGEIIVQMEDDIARDWLAYKRLGGRADDLAHLSQNDSDPCNY